MRLILVRHGRTAANAAGRLQGKNDLPLDEAGRAEAAALATALGPVGRLISSPLPRAVETARALGRPVEIDDRWVELDYGEWEGRPVAQVTPEQWAAWRADPGFAPPGGESLADVAARVAGACAELAALRPGEPVVVVSHVSPIKLAVCWALGLGPAGVSRLHLDNAAICRIDIREGRPLLRSFNETGHLIGC